MRIHTDRLDLGDLERAAEVARVELIASEHGSRKRDHAFNVVLRGESNRAPNFGTGGATGSTEKAATWDQWGVFLAILFAVDPNATCWAYHDREDFNYQTDARFTQIGGGWEDYWPADAHGDHSWKFSAPRVHQCRHCSAVRKWRVREEEST